MSQVTTEPFRVETDLLGSRDIPKSSYWGVHSLRAKENFPISGRSISESPDLIFALVAIKEAAARANQALGLLDEKRSDGIQAACAEIGERALHDHFCVDMIQGGTGTSTNMNANEVIANRALELLGRELCSAGALRLNDQGSTGLEAMATCLRVRQSRHEGAHSAVFRAA